MTVRSMFAALAVVAIAATFSASPAAAQPCGRKCRSVIQTCQAAVGTPGSTCAGLTGAEKRTCRQCVKQGRKACKRSTVTQCKSDGTCTAGASANCRPGPTVGCQNPNGPTKLVLTVLGSGNDLDNGWKGVSHNFPTPANTQFTMCLSNCNKTDDSMCDARGPTGPGSINGTTFGPPLPLIAGGTAVCVINRFQPGDIAGSLDLATGAATSQVNLFSDVYVTTPTSVCPQCINGRCNSGNRNGQSCSVNGTVVVSEGIPANVNYQLSNDCPPSGNPTGTLNIPLPLTTGSVMTPGTGGSKPCREREAQGIQVEDDACGPAGCGNANCTGRACVSTTPDGTCVDSKGGISQACCNADTTTPCFDTRPGGRGINRTGKPLAPLPAFPDPTYPKSVEGLNMVATFCEAATTSFTVDQVTGLPGPGALIFNLRAEVSDQP
jgi:hypothetical protein